MQGYYGRPDATAESILEDDDGRWLRTGDIVTMDEDGYVTIHDRAKEMIKYKGYQIAPAELEALIMEHPDVADVAVIPKDSGTADGEYPKAFVVRRPRRDLDAAAVMAHVTAVVAPYKKVREVEFIDAIPKNPSGKILRRELKAQERAGRTAPDQPPGRSEHGPSHAVDSRARTRSDLGDHRCPHRPPHNSDPSPPSSAPGKAPRASTSRTTTRTA